jgi:hypothetical protein
MEYLWHSFNRSLSRLQVRAVETLARLPARLTVA